MKRLLLLLTLLLIGLGGIGVWWACFAGVSTLARRLELAKGAPQQVAVITQLLALGRSEAEWMVARHANARPLMVFDHLHRLLVVHDRDSGRTYRVHASSDAQAMPMSNAIGLNVGSPRATAGMYTDSLLLGPPPPDIAEIRAIGVTTERAWLVYRLRSKPPVSLIALRVDFADGAISGTTLQTVDDALRARLARLGGWPRHWK